MTRPQPTQTSFFRGAVIMAGAEVLVRVKGLVVLPLLTHRFGTINYGAWSQVVVLAGVLVPLIVLGTDSAVARFLPAREPSLQQRQFLAWVIGLALTTAVVCALLVLIRRPLARVAFGSESDFLSLVPLSLAYVATNVLLAAVRSWVRIRNQARTFSAISVVQAVWNVVAVVIVLVQRGGPYQLVALLILGDGVIGLTLLGRALSWHPPRPEFSTLGSFVRFGLPLVPAGFAVWGLNLMDRLFLVHYHSLSDVGAYSVAYALGYLVIQVVVNPIWTMYANSAAAMHDRGEREGVQALFESSVRLISFLIVPAIGGSALISSSVISALAPPGFVRAGPVIPIVMAGYLFSMLSAYYEVSLGLVYRQYLFTVGVGLAAVVNLGLNIVLIPPYSILGAAVATSVAFLVQLLFSFGVCTRRRLLQTPFTAFGRILAATAAMVVLVLPLSRAVHLHPEVQVVTVGAVGVAVYFGLALLFRATTVADIRRFARAVTSSRGPAGGRSGPIAPPPLATDEV